MSLSVSEATTKDEGQVWRQPNSKFFSQWLGRLSSKMDSMKSQ